MRWIPVPFLIIAAMATAIIGALWLGAAPLAFAAGLLVVGVIAWIATRSVAEGGEIETRPALDRDPHRLIVLSNGIDLEAAVADIARSGQLRPEDSDTLVLAAAPTSFSERWVTDSAPKRAAEFERLRRAVVSAGGQEARVAVGDADIVQAVEDQLRSFPASEVLLVTGPPEADERGNEAAEELRRRLAQPLVRHLVA